MVGFKLYQVPSDIQDSISLWESLGFDAVMIGRDCLKSSDFIQALKASKLKWSIVEPIFLADEDVPLDRLALDQNGNRASDEWVRFICPNDEELLNKVYARIEADAKLGPDGMSLDFIRFFNYWEKYQPDASEKDFPETCFCPRCVEEKKQYKNNIEWRNAVVLRTVKHCRELIKSISPDTAVGIHTVPWIKSKYNNALVNVVGQDLKNLAPYADYLSPMIYHKMIGETTGYIKQVVDEVSSYGTPVLPSIQAKECYKEPVISVQEFTEALDAALSGKSKGVLFYEWNYIKDNNELCNIIKSRLNK